MSHSVYNSSVPKRKGKKLLDLKKFKMHLPNKTIQAILLEKRWGNHEAWKKGMTSLSPPWPGNASWTNQKKRHSLAPKSRKKSTITAFTSSHLLLYKLISVIIVKFLHKLKEYIYIITINNHHGLFCPLALQGSQAAVGPARHRHHGRLHRLRRRHRPHGSDARGSSNLETMDQWINRWVIWPLIL